jgi:FMN-dependent NADH-azoreductase
MKKILVIESSPRGKISVSRTLTREIVNRLTTSHPDSKVIVRDLNDPQPAHLKSDQTVAMLTPSENQTSSNKAALSYSDELVNEVMSAEVIVIGAPMYSFSVSSTLKVWLDLISRPRITFQYTTNGPVGLVKGKKVYLAVATGGVYSKGPQTAYDFLVPYLKAILGFMGMTDITVVRVEGIALPEFQMDEAISQAFAEVKL